jgi:hypothetical protein
MIFESAEYSSKVQQQILWLPARELLAEACQRAVRVSAELTSL